MKCISFGSLNKKIVYPLLLSLFCAIYYIYFSYLTNNTELKHFINIYYCLLDPFSLILCGILSLISKYKFNKAKKEKEDLIIPQDSLTTKNSLKIEIHTFSLLRITEKDSFPIIPILSVTFFYFCCIIVTMFQGDLDWFGETSKFIQLICTIILSFFILHIKVHRHNYFSVALVALSCFSISFIKSTIKGNQFDLINFFWTFVYYFLYSVYEVNEKYIMNKSTISPYSLLFFEGIFLFLFGIILLIILNNIECKIGYSICDSNYLNFIFDNRAFISLLRKTPSLILYLFLFLLVNIFLNIFRILTIKEFSPIYRIAIDCIAFVYIFIFEFIIGKNDFDLKNCLIMLCYILLVLSLLVYIEIIIIHLFKLDVNTEIEIKKRSLEDNELIQELNINKLIPFNKVL